LENMKLKLNLITRLELANLLNNTARYWFYTSGLALIAWPITGYGLTMLGFWVEASATVVSVIMATTSIYYFFSPNTKSLPNLRNLVLDYIPILFGYTLVRLFY
jgi:CHASE2 domain-containing sensor protein